ncbi:MAG: HIT family protein [Acidimicrobiia bacterium]|nr:HIT family protein [Acidimicrobiia bacterium]
MASVFTKIIDGELPGRFVWKDEHCVAFLSIAPLQPGHTLVVPREEIDHWIDLPPELAAHLMVVAREIGAAQQRAFSPARVGLMIAGMEVPHTHLHVVPINAEADMRFDRADTSPPEAMMEDASRRITEALGDTGVETRAP